MYEYEYRMCIVRYCKVRYLQYTVQAWLSDASV